MSSSEPVRCAHTPSPDRICTLCGSYAFPGLHQYGMKSTRFFGTISDLSLLRSLSDSFHTLSETIQRIDKVQERLRLGLNTVALGVYLFYSVFSGEEQQMKHIGICLCLAAKFLEHTDKRMVHKFRKHFKKVFQKQQYLQKEAQILLKIDFNLNIANFTDYLFNYLSKGGCFSSEMIDILKFEESIIKASKKVIFNGNFMKFKPEELATAVLYNCRVEYKLIQVWNWHIEQCTKVPANEAQRRNLVIKPFLMAKIH